MNTNVKSILSKCAQFIVAAIVAWGLMIVMLMTMDPYYDVPFALARFVFTSVVVGLVMIFTLWVKQIFYYGICFGAAVAYLSKYYYLLSFMVNDDYELALKVVLFFHICIGILIAGVILNIYKKIDKLEQG